MKLHGKNLGKWSRFAKEPYAIIATFFVLISITSVFLARSHDDSVKTDLPIWSIKPTRAASPLTMSQAAQFSSALTSDSETRLSSVVALPPNQQLTPNVLQQLASLGNVTFDVATFHDNHNGTATITAHIEHPAPGTGSAWTVQLLNVNGQWKISETETAQ
jgi:hypothetical protein